MTPAQACWCPPPSHPTPRRLPHRGTLLESKFEIFSRLNRARAKLWGQVSPMAHETPRPRPRPSRLAPPRAPPPAGAHAQFLQRLSLRPDPANRPASQARPRPSQPARGGPAARHRPLRRTAAVTHRPLPKARGRCLPASRGRPARHQHSGNKTERPPDLGAGQDRTAAEEEGGSRVTNPRPGARPARPAPTEPREAGGGSEPRETGRHSGGGS